jgi:hypothetical protein
MIMRKFLCLIILLLLVSCSYEKPAEVEGKKLQVEGNGDIPKTSDSLVPGQHSLQIMPTNVIRNSTIYAVAQGFNLSDAKIVWMVNGIQTDAPSSGQFKATMKGDKIQAKAFLQGKEVLSNVIQVGNSPPVISKVRILPEVFKPGDTLSVEASGSDPDDYDDVTISYEWIKNGEPAGTGKQIDVPLKRGDKVSVKITPFDGEDYGTTVILHREITNMPPMITQEQKMSFDGDLFTLKINAKDVDGDELTYSLKSAPDGMVIDPVSGMITWKVPREFQGKVPLTVCVNDGHGGEAIKAFNLDIKPESK